MLHFRQKFLLGALILVLILSGLIFLNLGLNRLEARLDSKAATAASVSTESSESDFISYNDESGSMTYYQGSWYQKKKHLETILVIGLDKDAAYIEQESGAQNTQQADFLLLLLLDKDAGTCTAIHINRDTMATIRKLGVAGTPAGYFTGQLALAHTYGNTGRECCQNTVRAVSSFLYDTPINHYISFTMDSVPLINDSLGGVSLTLMDDFSDLYDGYTEGASVTLIGEQALSYVRARGGLSEPTNTHRMERQRQYLTVLFDLLREQSTADAYLPLQLLMEVREYLVSDCTIDQLSTLADTALALNFTGIETIAGDAVLGEKYIEFTADEASLQELMIRLFYEPADMTDMAD